MHAMIRHYRMGIGSIDDLMHKVDTQFADRLREKLGIIGYQAVDTGSGTIMTITLFATEEELRRSEHDAEGVRKNLAEFEVQQIGAFAGPVMVARGSDRLLIPILRQAVRRMPEEEDAS